MAHPNFILTFGFDSLSSGLTQNYQWWQRQSDLVWRKVGTLPPKYRGATLRKTRLLVRTWIVAVSGPEWISNRNVP